MEGSLISLKRDAAAVQRLLFAVESGERNGAYNKLHLLECNLEVAQKERKREEGGSEEDGGREIAHIQT